jgi:gamma-glutamyltranspeptidase/glutathione hydrolase
MQTQALVQVFLNMSVFGMNLQEAINAPRFRSLSLPASFASHESAPGTPLLEGNLYDQFAEGKGSKPWGTRWNTFRIGITPAALSAP